MQGIRLLIAIILTFIIGFTALFRMDTLYKRESTLAFKLHAERAAEALKAKEEAEDEDDAEDSEDEEE